MTFDGIAPQHFQNALTQVYAKLGQQAPSPLPDNGQLSKLGVTVMWNYDGASQLTVQIERESMFDPSLATIEKELTDFINSTA